MDYPTAQDLYPLVQDLTEIEYNNAGRSNTHNQQQYDYNNIEYNLEENSPARTTCCCADATFASFTLQDLVMPTMRARSLPTPLSLSAPSTPKNKSKGHKRGNSLFNFTIASSNSSNNSKDSDSSKKKHRRSRSSPVSPTSVTEDATSTTFSTQAHKQF